MSFSDLKSNQLNVVYPYFITPSGLFECHLNYILSWHRGSFSSFSFSHLSASHPSFQPHFPSSLQSSLIFLYSPPLLLFLSSSLSFWLPPSSSFLCVFPALFSPQPPPGSNLLPPSSPVSDPLRLPWALQKDTFIPGVKFLLISASQTSICTRWMLLLCTKRPSRVWSHLAAALWWILCGRNTPHIAYMYTHTHTQVRQSFIELVYFLNRASAHQQGTMSGVFATHSCFVFSQKPVQ